MDDISLRQFKQQVLTDYRTAYTGQEMLRMTGGEMGCDSISLNSDVAQTALSHFVLHDDVYLSSSADLTYSIATGNTTASSFFSSYFSSSEIDSSTTSDTLSVAAGTALAIASTKQNKRIVVCTLGNHFCDDGSFFESICFASARSLPLCIIVWNSNGHTANGNLPRLLSGFGNTSKQKKTLSIECIKGDDYAELCKVMNRQTMRSRKGETTLTFVSSSETGTQLFSSWLCDKQLSTDDEIKKIEEECRNIVERDYRKAYLVSLTAETPQSKQKTELKNIEHLYPISKIPIMPMRNMNGIVDKAIGVAQIDLLPILEVKADDIVRSTLDRNTEIKMIMRTSDIHIGRILSAVSESCVVMCPATASDTEECYKMLLSDPCQSVVCETTNKNLEVDMGEMRTGGSKRLTEGEDITLVAFGSGIGPATEAVEILQSHNTRAELIGLHSLRPLDINSLIIESVRKTKRLLIIDTDPNGRTEISDHLVQRLLPLRYLLHEPYMVRPKQMGHYITAHDVCVGVSEAMK